MSKERLIAFTDAVLAIVMTILVLELQLPAAPTLEALLALTDQFIAYAVSFFWLSVMWVNLHNEWEQVEQVTLSMIWWNLFLLFVTAVLPYGTRFASLYFNHYFAQLFYGLLVFLITVAFYGLCHATAKSNPETTVRHSQRFLRIEVLDHVIKLVGLLLGLVYPPLIMFAVIVTAVIVLFSIQHYIYCSAIRKKERKEGISYEKQSH
ncbi:DUF1211 domain-containing protein [Streptococcus chenjunshii]|uniref:DUF1211 domain-containing protein n=1 Tax=Streptococcus chenjunshii TaxID=2173853 RepID=A0A372KJD8_9STRE|nr:TMEM175 family protein [Streptococcus chenjunshii]AXQ77884.1 DUF1211 domain-containing protein [Streptococcus chenjunshii]RFU50206.1 DUF1211 domain-containing protein [Streptococcus chenjunshii]RFU52385.1 DUF1211 domain-containing protein [Streptococcus chenjunshii]